MQTTPHSTEEGAERESTAPFPLEWNGVHLGHLTSKEHMDKLMEAEFRPDDVIICSYPRSGSHWLYEMTAMLVEGRAEPVQRRWESSWLEIKDFDLEDVKTWASPRVFVSHLPFNKLPEDVHRKKCKLIVIERNPKDVAVSLFQLLGNAAEINFIFSPTFNGFLDLFLSGMVFYNSIFDHVKSFRNGAKENPEVSFYIASYEDFKQDHRGQLKLLSQFLGLERGEQLFDDICRLTDFATMKAYKDQQTTAFERELFKSGKCEFYRKGEADDWKIWFTVAQSEKFDQECRRQMEAGV